MSDTYISDSIKYIGENTTLDFSRASILCFIQFVHYYG